MRISDLSSDVCSSDLLGIELTTQEWQSLAAIDAAPATEKTRIGLTFPRTLNELESDQLLRASVREYEAPANQLDMPLSDERVALVRSEEHTSAHQSLMRISYACFCVKKQNNS